MYNDALCPQGAFISTVEYFASHPWSLRTTYYACWFSSGASLCLAGPLLFRNKAEGLSPFKFRRCAASLYTKFRIALTFYLTFHISSRLLALLFMEARFLSD